MDIDQRSTGSNSVNLGACVVSVADAYDAITSDRAYRKGKPPWLSVCITKVIGYSQSLGLLNAKTGF